MTLPFPGFATDLLPMALGLAAVSDGASLITENIFDGRFMFVQELVRLGADIRTDGHHAVVRGRERLSGRRCGPPTSGPAPGLVIAGLCADGVTEVSHVHHIDRGYPDFVADLRRLGATVKRIRARTPSPPETCRHDRRLVPICSSSPCSRRLAGYGGAAGDAAGPVHVGGKTSTRCRPSRPTVVVARMPAAASSAGSRGLLGGVDAGGAASRP